MIVLYQVTSIIYQINDNTAQSCSFYANKNGKPEGRPYFSKDGERPLTAEEWRIMRSKFYCPHGYTNVWERAALRGNERVKMPKSNSKSAHLNQKPLDLMRLIIEASTDPGDVVWEPFGGTVSCDLSSAMVCLVDLHHSW